MKITDFPKKDRPSDFDLEHVKRTDIREDGSCKYYYGIGVPVDYEKACRLAFLEMAVLNGQEDPIEGSSILLMLYANGFGVERNLDISIRLACANVSGSGAEVEGRLQHLKDIRSGAAKGVFDVCDDATSGYLSNFCASVQSELADIARTSSIDSMIRNWPKPRRTAYERLRGAASGFFSQRVESEIDQSGTARIAIADEESASLEDADKHFQHGTVTQAGIRSTQRKWIGYRDAWVVFGAALCPEVTETSWKTSITQERISQLQDFVDE